MIGWPEEGSPSCEARGVHRMTFLDHDPVIDATVTDLPGLGDTSFDGGDDVGSTVPAADASRSCPPRAVLFDSVIIACSQSVAPSSRPPTTIASPGSTQSLMTYTPSNDDP